MTQLTFVGSGYAALVALYGWQGLAAALCHVALLCAARPPRKRRSNERTR